MMDEHLQAIREELSAAKAHLAVLQETLEALEAAPRDGIGKGSVM